MVIGERLVLSTLLAGLYLPGIEELYLRSLGRRSGGGEERLAREEEAVYHLASQGPPGLELDLNFGLDIDLGLGRDLGLDLGSGSEIGLGSGVSVGTACNSGALTGRVGLCDSTLAVQDSLTLYGGGRRLVDLLREKSPSLNEAPDLLRRHGFASEASQLERPGLLDLARQYLVEGAVLTPFHPESSWIWERQANLPYALWCAQPRSAEGQGEFPSRLFAVVGSRDLDAVGSKGAWAAAKALHQGGWTLVTGGAIGADSIALEGVAGTLTPRGVVLHPWGLSCDAGLRLRRRWPWAWHLSVCPPWHEFEGSYAHQRNRIIFALSEGALSISPRFRRGGTWSGAVECLRGRLAPVAVLADSGESEALAALKNLGAYEVSLSGLEGSGGPELLRQIVLEGRHRRSGLAVAPAGQESLFGAVASMGASAGASPTRSAGAAAGASTRAVADLQSAQQYDQQYAQPRKHDQDKVKESAIAYAVSGRSMGEAVLAA